MSFAENLLFLRKQKDITQEQLAEQLEVSRQSVSKWESGQSYPEMEKLLQICSMFHCSMDTLMQGDVRKNFSEDIYGYDRQKNQFSKWISAGVGLILLGISVMMFLTSAGMNEEYAAVVFFTLLIVAVMVMVVMGLQMEQFSKKHPVIEDFYTEEEKDQAYRKFTVRIAVGVGLILVGLLVQLAGGVALEEAVLSPEAAEQRETVLDAVFMLMISVAVPILTYAGMQKEKYDIEKYNKEGNPSPERKKRNALKRKVCGCIMLLATCVYLFWSFTTNNWGVTWVVYPIAGILCGVAALVLSGGDK
ncbi:MAG: helix-turn-helix transcriptional regulator [Lachnospiraceae bacterium]|nr:helix-turn-helix transcriptional regulator [Lachnospiraceae bacterium]